MKRLSMDDQMSVQEHRQKMLSLSDEEVKSFGYPSVAVLRLSYQLSDIAGTWRATKDDALVQEYERVLYKMILNGYDVETLPIQDQLPDDKMPDLPPQSVQEAILNAYQSSVE